MSSLLKKIIINLLRRPASHLLPELQLSLKTAPQTPFSLFKDWFELAEQVDPEWANALTLTTATSNAIPSNRIVLLKGYDSSGFVFYTNYGSRKARELEENPNASMVFWWKELYRQIRIEGAVQRVSGEESDTYFQSRPRGSRIGAWASKQSSIIDNRKELVEQVKLVDNQYKEGKVPRPPFWGGYRLIPKTIEFWQARDDRLHDRLRYRRSIDSSSRTTPADCWILERISP